MCIIAPSLLEADYQHLGEELARIEQAGAEYVHFDIMDGTFVPNLSFGIKMIQGLRGAAKLVFDVHMMVQEPVRFVKKLRDAGADTVIVHYEACENILETLQEIKGCGMKAGLALNPESSEDLLTDELLQAADVIHVMTVRPGREGEAFIPGSLDKIHHIRQMLKRCKLRRPIETDGNIGFHNVQEVILAGSDIIVSGKALFHGDLKENIRRMRELTDNPGQNGLWQNNLRQNDLWQNHQQQNQEAANELSHWH